MDIKVLTYATTLARHGSYTSAARELFITPQGLSNSIRRLEESLGYELFEQKNGMIKPTEFGELFIDYAGPICNNLQNMQKALDKLAQEHASTIKLASPCGILGYIGADNIKRFDTLQDGTTVSVIGEVSEAECESRLIGGFYDYAMIVGPIQSLEIRSLPFVRDYFFAWVNKDNPLSCKSELTLRDFDGQDIMFISDSYKCHGLIVAEFESVGVHPRIHDADEVVTIFESALQNTCIGLTLRNHAAKLKSDSIVALPVKELPWSCSLCHSTHKTLLKSDTAFIEYMMSLSQFYS